VGYNQYKIEDEGEKNMSKLLRETLDSIKREMPLEELCAEALQKYLGFDFCLEDVDGFEVVECGGDTNLLNAEFEYNLEFYYVTLKKIGSYDYKVIYTNF